jgi:hypothetical protein
LKLRAKAAGAASGSTDPRRRIGNLVDRALFGVVDFVQIR